MKVLCIGKICVDIVSYMDYYPHEDSDQVIKLQRWSQGGNASNSCVVMDQLRSVFCKGMEEFPCELFGSLGNDLSSQFVRHLLNDVHHVDMERCPIRDAGHNGQCRLGTTCIIINRSSATRTLLHAEQDVPDIGLDDFVKANFDFGQYEWIHFETRRNSGEFGKMLDMVLSWRKNTHSTRPLISVELEKDRSDCGLVFKEGIDYFFVGKDFAKKRECSNMRDTATYVSTLLSPDTVVVCPWGEEGACVLENGTLHTCQAYQSTRAIDTLGAGDTFFAAFIFSKCYLKIPSNQALKFACLVAGVKCGTLGYDNIADRMNEMIKSNGEDYLTNW